VADPKIGDTSVSCRKDSRGDFVTMADAIESLIARRPGLTAAQISEMLFTNRCETERIDLICRRMIAEGRLHRSGAGRSAARLRIRQNWQHDPDCKSFVVLP
jgi:hypothetical protein